MSGQGVSVMTGEAASGSVCSDGGLKAHRRAAPPSAEGQRRHTDLQRWSSAISKGDG